MMEGWKEVRFGEITELIKRGIAPKYVEEGGYIVINQKCIRDGVLSFSDSRLSSKEKKVAKEKFVQIGDVLINSTGTGTLGRTAPVRKLPGATTVDTHVTILRGNEKVDKLFLGYLASHYEPLITLLGKGSTNQIELGASDLKVTKIVIPESKATQRKIASILSAYDDLIENNLKRIKLLEEKAQLTYEEWFVRMKFPGHETTPINPETGLPDGWEKEKFEKNFTLNNGYAFKSGDYKTSGVKILRTKDYSQTKWVNIEQPIFLSNEKAYQYQKYYVQPYDLMLIMVGASIGNYGIILPRDTGVLQNQNQWAIRAKTENLNFFKILMMEDLIQKLLGKKTGAARDFFRASFLKEIELNMPSELILIQFNEKIKPLYESINNLFIQIDNLKEARDILLPRLMTGMINVDKMNIETLQPTTT